MEMVTAAKAAKAAKSAPPSCDAMVTARVPRGVKERGDAILREIGSSPTKLVNAAYDYVLENKKLPARDEGASLLRPGVRKLSPSQKRTLCRRLEGMRAGKLHGCDSFDDMLCDALLERYAGKATEAQKAS